jgi:hypothetical protein
MFLFIDGSTSLFPRIKQLFRIFKRLFESFTNYIETLHNGSDRKKQGSLLSGCPI